MRQMDAGEEKDVEGVVNEALEKYGRLDIFFANAGIVGSHQRIYEASGEDFMEVMKTNALGYVPHSVYSTASTTPLPTVAPLSLSSH